MFQKACLDRAIGVTLGQRRGGGGTYKLYDIGIGSGLRAGFTWNGLHCVKII